MHTVTGSLRWQALRALRKAGEQLAWQCNLLNLFKKVGICNWRVVCADDDSESPARCQIKVLEYPGTSVLEYRYHEMYRQGSHLLQGV